MRKELDAKLREEFPELFNNEGILGSGVIIDVGDGWYPLLREICLGFKKIHKGMNDIVFNNIRSLDGILVYTIVMEGKEIFNPDDPCFSSCEPVRLSSAKVCERCGSEGRIHQVTGKSKQEAITVLIDELGNKHNVNYYPEVPPITYKQSLCKECKSKLEERYIVKEID